MVFIVDTQTHNLTAGYGPRRVFYVNGVRTAPFHYGMDFAPEIKGTNTILYMPKAGTVRSVGTKRDAGRYVIAYIPQWNKWIRYCHMQSYAVRTGDRLPEAHPVGRMGATGTATGVHVHFEVYEDEALTKRIDPKPFIWHEPNPVHYKAHAPIPAQPAPKPAPKPQIPVVNGRVKLDTRWAAYGTWQDAQARRNRISYLLPGTYTIKGVVNNQMNLAVQPSRETPRGRAWINEAASAGLV